MTTTLENSTQLMDAAWALADQDVAAHTQLDGQTRAILDVAMTVALRSSERAVSRAIAKALDTGVAVSTLGYAIVQLAAYIGMIETRGAAERLDALARERGLATTLVTTPAELDERYAYGIDHYGRLNPVALDNIRSAFDAVAGRLIDATFASFGDTFGQSPLDLKLKQMITVSALAAMGGVAPQLQFHIGAARYVGVTEASIIDIILQVQTLAGMPAAYNALISAKAAFDAGDDASPGYR